MMRLLMRTFVLGAVVGAASVWLWGDRVSDYVEVQSRDVRERIADVLDVLTDVLATLRDGVEPLGAYGVRGASKASGDLDRRAAGGT